MQWLLIEDVQKQSPLLQEYGTVRFLYSSFEESVVLHGTRRRHGIVECTLGTL